MPKHTKIPPIARELQNRLVYLSDPLVKWVKGPPGPGESCLVYDGTSFSSALDGAAPAFFRRHGFSSRAALWLQEFLLDYWVGRVHPSPFASITWFNDHFETTRDDVLWMLEEAVEQAKWEGV